MEDALTIFFFSLFLLEVLVGILGDGLLAGLFGREWVRRRKLPPCDMIVASLGASRFFLLWVSMLNGICLEVIPKFYYSPIIFYSSFVWALLNLFSFWFAAGLSIFYCLKIATFTNPLFLWMKQKTSGMVPWLLLGSVFVSCVSTFPCIIYYSIKPPWMNNSENGTEAVLKTFQSLKIMPVIFIPLSVPFLLLLISSILLTTSLRRHLRAMQHHGPSLQDCSTKAHAHALAMLASFLSFYVWYFIILIVTSTTAIPSGSPWFWLFQVITFLGTTCHSLLLTWSNPKIRGALERGLRHIPACQTPYGTA
ncbi:taste receptor type 2 member 41-like [Ornithorhynchus anatinus]|uniref:taste receptor type 2 member 41-like n=1 Tax=Ornithorhynchus anatinus TaxID=9258 RepID=UPI000155507F|nr:taste receptor type 2 member 41-like [Ornithorhynchus anatinus]BDF92183.1 taste receptor type 2 member 811 [Ornithorhynchus anatinus]BDF92184.1 taste receptor type 2 member 811 [Ornithorhynchus anatinus]